MPPLHPALMAIFLVVFAVMAIAGLIASIKNRRPFPAALMLLTTVVFLLSAYITGTQ